MTRPRATLCLLLQHRLELRAELGRVPMLVTCGRVLDRRIEEFLFAIGGNCHRAFLLARIVAAVDMPSCHLNLPQMSLLKADPHAQGAGDRGYHYNPKELRDAR